MTPIVVERFADNGEFSHFELINKETGDLLWTQDEDNSFSTIKISGFQIQSDKDSLKITNLGNDKSIIIAPRTSNSCVIYTK